MGPCGDGAAPSCVRWPVGGQGLPESLRMRAAYVVGRGGRRGTGARDGRPRRGGEVDCPSDCRWVLAGVRDPVDLWRAEAGWWRRVEDDAFGLRRRAAFGRATVVGAAALLAVDAWRVRAALEVAARGGYGPAMEAFDAVA